MIATARCNKTNNLPSRATASLKFGTIFYLAARKK